MFENMKNMAGLMKDLPRIKQTVEQVKQRLAETVVEAETGGGAVKVTANGLMKVLSVEINEALMRGLVDPGEAGDRALAGELITGAVNAAIEKAREKAEVEMGAAMGELGLPLPPGGLV